MHGSPVSRRMQLTELAGQAAENGRWDVVRECYRARESTLADGPMPPEEAERLLRADRQIQGRVQLAQMALASLIHDVAAIRLRLKGLRQGQGGSPSDSPLIVLEA